MANIADLNKLDTEVPSSFKEWLSRFSEEDRKTIVTSISIHDHHQCYKILSELDENAFPFAERSLLEFRRRIKADPQAYLEA